MKIMINLYLFRHGQATTNLNPYIISGSEDSHLTLLGKRQARYLGKRISKEGLQFDRVYCSDITRAMQTAEIALPGREIIIDPRLREINQGDWTGKLRKYIYTLDTIQKINEDNWNFAPPNGESQREVAERQYEVIKEDIQKYGVSGRRAFFGHGMAIKCLLGITVGLDKRSLWRSEIENASITHIRGDGNLWWLMRFNDHSHINESDIK